MKPFKDYEDLTHWVRVKRKCPLCKNGKPSSLICNDCHDKWLADTSNHERYDTEKFTDYVNMKRMNTWTVPCAECNRPAQYGDYLCKECRTCNRL